MALLPHEKPKCPQCQENLHRDLTDDEIIYFFDSYANMIIDDDYFIITDGYSCDCGYVSYLYVCTVNKKDRLYCLCYKCTEKRKPVKNSTHDLNDNDKNMREACEFTFGKLKHFPFIPVRTNGEEFEQIVKHKF